MKKIKSLFTIISILVITVMCFGSGAYARNSELYKDSVVFIGTTVEFSATNYDLTFQSSGSGTGFAVGMPGEKVQYIATAHHVVREPEGVYALYVEKDTGNIVDLVPLENGTDYPGVYEKTVSGAKCYVFIDYFKTKTVDAVAIFSGASNDYISVSITQSDENKDVALCKLQSEPTGKISPLPLQFKKDVKDGTDVSAIGYPALERSFTTEHRLDGSDSTLTTGTISKVQRIDGKKDPNVTFDAYNITAKTLQGMSGGPVISDETESVIGFVSFSYIDYNQAKTQDYAICIDYLKPLLDAEGVKYKIYSTESGGYGLWIGIGIGVLALAGIAVVIILILRKKKSEPEFRPAPVAAPAPAPAPAPQAAPSDKKYLIGVSGPFAGQKFGVTSRAIIGRDKSRCNVAFPIDQPGVSGLHCEVKAEGGVMILKDCGSSYGTFLADGTKLEPNVPVVITSGTKFWIGSKNNTFEVKY